MSGRKEYEQKVKQKLEDLEREIDALREKVKSTEAELTSDHHGRMEKLHELKEEVADKIDDLLEAGDDAWEEIQEGVEHYWKALGNELKAFDEME
jgi:peptidoglycan hydrolase CwlO-like protein